MQRFIRQAGGMAVMAVMLLIAALALAQNPSPPIVVTRQYAASGTSSGILVAGYTNHTITFSPATNAATTGCLVQVDSAPTATGPWTAAGLIASTACNEAVGAGGTVTVTSTAATYARVNVTAITGGTISVTYSAVNAAVSKSSGGGSAGCTATTAGTVCYYNGTSFVPFAGNTSGTAVFQENSAGLPSWGAGSSTTFEANGAALSSSATVNFENSAAFNGVTFTFANPSAGNVQLGATGTFGNAALTNSATTVNSQTCTLGAACTIPLQTNSIGNTSQAGINLETSTVNAVGLTVTPTNSATNVEKFEVTGGAYTGTAANVTGIVAVANGGNGTATPALIAGTNITLSGSWPAITINSSAGGGNTTSTSLSTGSVPVANGANSIINSLFTDVSNTGSYTGTNGFSVPNGGIATGSASIPAAGLISLPNSTFVTNLGSAATASNTVLFPATVPTTLHSVYCVTASTTCTLTDTGYAYNAIPVADVTGAAPQASPTFTGTVTYPRIATTTNCAGAGTAANPSVASCSAAPAGFFSCATNASTGTCVVDTSAVTANSVIQIQPDSSLGTALSVTCNTTADSGLTAPRVSARSAGTSFTIALGTFSSNPECYSFIIVN